MTLDSGHSLCLCESHELVLKVLITLCHHETDVHDRTVFNRCCALEERVAVNFAVEKLSLLLVDFIDSLYASLLLEPLQCLVHHVDCEHRRSIEHRLAGNMSAEVKHCRNIAAHLAEHILLHDEERHSGRTHVLLGTTIDHGIFAHIHRTAHDV